MVLGPEKVTPSSCADVRWAHRVWCGLQPLWSPGPDGCVSWLTCWCACSFVGGSLRAFAVVVVFSGVMTEAETRAWFWRWLAFREVMGNLPPPPPCACTALSKHGVGVEPPFEEILGPLFLWSRMEDWVFVERLYRERGAHSCL